MVASGYDTRNRRARRPQAEGSETVPRGADGERRPRVLRGARAGDQGGAHRARTQSTGPRGRRRRLVRVPLRHRDGPRETRVTVVPRDRRGHAPLPQHADARGRALPRPDRWRGGTSAAAAAGAGRPASGRDPGEDGPHERGRAVAGGAQVVPRRTDARRGRAGSSDTRRSRPRTSRGDRAGSGPSPMSSQSRLRTSAATSSRTRHVWTTRCATPAISAAIAGRRHQGPVPTERPAPPEPRVATDRNLNTARHA